MHGFDGWWPGRAGCLVLPRLPPAQLVPGVRVARQLDPQGVDLAVLAAQQGAQVRPAKREIDRLHGPSDDADAPAVGRHDPDPARPGAINPADAVDLEAVGYPRLAALVEVGEDAAPDHVAGRVEPDRVDVLRGARV